MADVGMDEARGVIASGLVDIGAHTVHHLALKGRTSNQVTEEVFESKTMIEHEFGIHVVSFAYPFGSLDSQAGLPLIPRREVKTLNSLN
jgi:peptidoglycan/xylan/chitin deacetylase (PgdA/CDA1 family)